MLRKFLGLVFLCTQLLFHFAAPRVLWVRQQGIQNRSLHESFEELTEPALPACKA